MAIRRPSVPKAGESGAIRAARVVWAARAMPFGFALFALACSATPTPKQSTPTRASASRQTISVLALNDLHGRMERLPVFAGYVEAVREKHLSDDGGVLLLDAGDIFQGTLESNLFEGAMAIEAYNLMGFDAATVGNHEFDFGPVGPRSTPSSNDSQPHGALRARMIQARFPFVSANLQRHSTQRIPEWENLSAAVVLERFNRKIGVVGALTKEAPDVIKSANFMDLEVLDPATLVAVEARKLRVQGVDAVIALVHLGGSCSNLDDPDDLSSCELDRELFRFADKLPAGLVDVVLSGHHHAPVAHRYRGMALLQAYWGGAAFSRADLHFERGRRGLADVVIHPPQQMCREGLDPSIQIECTPLYYEGTLPEPDARVASVVDRASELAKSVIERPLGITLDATMARDKARECALGNLLVDLMRSSTDVADVAISNAGSLRSDLPAGDLTYGDLYRVMPFDNQLSVIELTGAQIATLFKAHLRNQEHGMVAISGFRVVADCDADRLRVHVFDDEKRPIDASALVRVLTSDFLATGGDGLFDVVDVPEARINVDIGRSVRGGLVAAMGQRSKLAADDPELFDPSKPRIDISQAVAQGCLTRTSPFSGVHRAPGPRLQALSTLNQY